MNYFAADLHIGDENILTYEHRPFKDLDEMEHIILCNWNHTVTNKDTVYLLGDIGDLSILSKLNGHIIIICGNHDNYDEIREKYPNIEVINHPIMVDYLWLSHKPIGYMPPEIPYLNIHGHLHRFNYGFIGRKWKDGNRYFCVSMEQINYTPISESEIRKILEV